MKSLNVLLLEDNELDAELSQEELRQYLYGYQCNFRCVTNKSDFLQSLDNFLPDLVLSDYNIPSYSGLQALRDFKVKFPFTPFLFVTGTQQEEVAANAIKEGAWDFVVKDRLSRLTMAAQNALRLREEQLRNREIQADVAKSELRFRTLFNTASDAIFMMKDDVFVDCNLATEKIYGCGKDQIIGQTPMAFSPPFQPSGRPSTEAAMEKINNALAGTPQFFIWQHKKFDGTVFDAEVSLNRLDVGEDVFIQAIVRDITERNKAEAENVRLATVVNATHNVVIIADEVGQIIWVNPAFTTVTGYEPDEVIGKKPGALLQGSETDKESVDYMSRQISAGEGFKDLEVINYTKAGKLYWVSIEVQPIRNGQGRTIQFIAIESDITERKKAELALAYREKRFSNLVQQSPVAVIEWDTKLNVVEWSQAAERIFGYTREEALTRNAYGLVLSPEPNANIEEMMKLLLEKKGGTRNKNENITRQGKKILCEWYNSPLTDDHGNVIGVVSMMEDITETIKAENELKESELKFRQIIQCSPMGIYVWEVDVHERLILVDCNAAADALTGEDNTRLIGLTIDEAFPGLRDTEIPGHWIAAALNGKAWFDGNMHYDEGPIKGHFEVYAFQAGSRRVAVMFINITERKEIEAAIKQKNEELLKINVELDRFVYSASHDLRAPIASLLGLVTVARLENNMEGIHALLDMQERSLLKLDNFIHEIVSYSRNNRLTITSEPIDFTALVEGIFEQLYFMNQLSTMERRISVAPDLAYMGDSKRITDILNNLISNAVKYADIDKPDPFVSVCVDRYEGGIKISVSDNGDGIHPDYLPKIFDMFYRATQRSTGSGIGLYIANEIAEKMGGTITVTSVLGRGSTFEVTLPVVSE